MATQIVFDDENLLTEILLRVPTKPVVRSKCVCRKWKLIVNSKPFARDHTALHPPSSEPNSGIFLYEPTDPWNFNYHLLSLPVGPRSPRQLLLPAPRIVQSCNGLLLLYADSTKSYLVYNPATHRFKVLPHLIIDHSCVLGVALAFDPLRFAGFKAICVVMLTESSPRKHVIFSYSSSDGDYDSCWKEWEGNPFYEQSDSVDFSISVYWNGSVHWISVTQDSLYFNVEDEKLCEYSLPPFTEDDAVYEHLCEFNGELHYVEGDDMFAYCMVYALVSYKQGWNLRYSVKSCQSYDSMLSMGSCVISRPCLVVYEGRREMLVHYGTKIMAYDLETNTWRTLCEDVYESWPRSRWANGFTYTATLATI